MITTYKEFSKPQYSYALIIAHEEQVPYKNGFNYFKNIVFPNISRYCNQHKIDFIIIDDFKRDLYKSTEDFQFNGRNTNFPFIAHKQILKHYQCVLLYNSNNLIKIDYPHFIDFYDMTDVDALSINGPHPLHKDSLISQHMWCNGWFGHTSIIKPIMGRHWFDQEQLLKFNMNDIVYRREYNKLHKDQFNLVILKDKFLLNMDYWAKLALQQVPKLGQNLSSQTMFQWIKNNCDLIPHLTDNKYVCTFFGGCGSYSNIWKLRYMMMYWVAQKYKKYHY